MFDDILTRWAWGYRREEHRRVICSLLLGGAEQIVQSADDVDLPNIEVLREGHQSSAEVLRRLGWCGAIVSLLGKGRNAYGFLEMI